MNPPPGHPVPVSWRTFFFTQLKSLGGTAPLFPSAPREGTCLCCFINLRITFLSRRPTPPREGLCPRLSRPHRAHTTRSTSSSYMLDDREILHVHNILLSYSLNNFAFEVGCFEHLPEFEG